MILDTSYFIFHSLFLVKLRRIRSQNSKIVSSFKIDNEYIIFFDMQFLKSVSSFGFECRSLTDRCRHCLRIFDSILSLAMHSPWFLWKIRWLDDSCLFTDEQYALSPILSMTCSDESDLMILQLWFSISKWLKF